MRYISTRDNKNDFNFRDAVYNGMAPDGGLFLPKSIPHLLDEPVELADLSLTELALHFLSPFVTGIDEVDFVRIVERSFNFDINIHSINKNISVAELYHGPTLAFKDFGARFLANIMSFYLHEEGKKCKILVATSGDTGSAVANAFLGMDCVDVVLLYPSGKVSKIQEQQLTTLGKNVTALEVQGNFDDCQRLVKMAFADEELRSKVNLSSANSISIARLLPQAVYYIFAYMNLYEKHETINFVVPSGNLGNITAGLMTKFAGLSVHRYYSALNKNDVFANYLSTGNFTPQPTIQTISNAMDVGSPSNLERIISLYHGDVNSVRRDVSAKSYSDEETLNKIGEIYREYNYLIDPHTATGMLYASELERMAPREHFVVMSTAHPAKFYDDVKLATGADFKIPERLASCLKKGKVSKIIGTEYEEFKELIDSRS